MEKIIDLSSTQLRAVKSLKALTQRKSDSMEYQTATIKGVSNLSRSDRDEIVMICDDLIDSGICMPDTNMSLRQGAIAQVFQKTLKDIW